MCVSSHQIDKRSIRMQTNWSIFFLSQWKTVYILHKCWLWKSINSGKKFSKCCVKECRILGRNCAHMNGALTQTPFKCAYIKILCLQMPLIVRWENLCSDMNSTRNKSHCSAAIKYSGAPLNGTLWSSSITVAIEDNFCTNACHIFSFCVINSSAKLWNVSDQTD